MIEILGLDAIIPQEVLGAVSPEVVDIILADIADAARAEWIRLAGEQLSSTRRDYINGIQPVQMYPGMAVISLVGTFPNYIEEGGPERDMREFLLGPNVPIALAGGKGKKMSKDGHAYRAIPFAHTKGKSKIAQTMGAAYQGHADVSNAKALGKAVYNNAKKLAASTSDPYKGTTTGDRLNMPHIPLLKKHHKTNIYQGMIRQEKTYAKATQSTFTTFRMISENPATEGWIRPQRQGAAIAPQVMEFVAKIAPMSFTAYVDGLSGK